MKVLLDIDRLQSEGKITPQEYQRLQQFARQEFSSLVFNILLIIGALGAISAWIDIAPFALSNLIMGGLISILGLWWMKRSPQWSAAALILSLLGALLVSYGILSLGNYTQWSWLLVTIALAGIGVATQVNLFIVFAIIASPSALLPIARTHTEIFSVLETNVFSTSLLYTSLSMFFYCIWRYRAQKYKQLLAYAGGTCFVMANIAFINGSMLRYGYGNYHADLYALILTGLLAMTCWLAVNTKNKWLFNVSAFFMFINIASKWTSVYGMSVRHELFLSLIALLIAFVIRYFNQEISSK